MEIVSLIASIVSVVLGLFAIWFAKKESKKSDESYQKTREVLDSIQHRSELIDRSVQLQQEQLIAIINKALDKIGQPPIDMAPISLEEIDAIFNEKTVEVDIPNKAGGKTAIIGKLKDINSAIEQELSEI